MSKTTLIISLCCVVPLLILGVIAFSGSDHKTQTTGDSVGTTIGDQAPSFSIIDRVGKKMQLSDYNGKKILVITSTATWCPTCIIEAREFTPTSAQKRALEKAENNLKRGKTLSYNEFVQKLGFTN